MSRLPDEVLEAEINRMLAELLVLDAAQATCGGEGRFRVFPEPPVSADPGAPPTQVRFRHQRQAETEKAEPMVPIKSTIRPDYIISLDAAEPKITQTLYYACRSL
jgi:hypothetical protein